MKKRMISGWAAITALGLFAGTAAADDTGVVRISDAPAAMPASATTTTYMSNGPAADGACDGAAGGHRCCLLRGGCYCPTRGFRPIGTAPIYHDAVSYGESQYWPAKFYGQPGWNLRPVFPQVYMPTDTTQLGFYYARVPQWLPNPGMYPPPPRPSDWHRRVVYADPVSMGAGGVEMGVSGQMMSPSGPVPASPTPAPVPAPQMTPAPLPGSAPAPPAAPEPPSASMESEAQPTQPVTLSPTPLNQ